MRGHLNATELKRICLGLPLGWRDLFLENGGEILFFFFAFSI